MVLHTLGLLVAVHGPLPPRAASGVEGTVRAAEDGRMLVQVLVEAPDERRWTATDSLGRYHLTDLTPGMHRLRFQAPGRIALELTALVPSSSTIHLDVELTQKPQELAPVVVLSPRGTSDSSAPAARLPRPLGSTWALQSVAAGRDLGGALVNGEGAQSHGGEGGTLHFQGGSSDHLLLTLDGFPVYGATHFGPAWSAVNPDLVQDITLHTGAAPSEEGGRLSGTVDVRTTLLASDNFRAQGAVTPGDVRQLVRGALPGGRGHFLLGGRRSLRSLFIDGALGEQNGYEDWLGTMAFHLGGGRLRFLVYRAANQLAFESRSDSPGQSQVSESPSEPASPLNNLEWVSHTAGIAWERTAGNQSLRLAAWRAGVGTSVQWLDPRRPLAMRDQFVELGIRGRTAWAVGQGDIAAGFSVRQLRSSYDAHAPISSSPSSPAAGLETSSNPTVIAGSVRGRWHWGNAASLEGGIRANWGSFDWAGSEPWLAVQLRPWRALTLAAQAGRAYQFTQSWINEESFLTTLAGLEVPVVAGTTGMPVARSDNIAARVELNTGAGWTVSLEGYSRYLSNLFLSAPTSTQPFTATTSGFGSGKATGVIARSSLTRGPVEVALSLGLTHASRTLGSMRYTPAFARTGSLHAAALVHLDSATAAGVALTVGSGQPTTPLTAFDWQPYNPWSGNGELAGTPTNLGGSINTFRLPSVRRVDIGLRRAWRLGPQPGRAITTSFTIENLLNHRNAIGLIGARQPLPAEFLYAGSRALRLELGWAF